MSDLLAARGQMSISLAFHILFAAAGMAMPLLMLIADFLALRTRDPGWSELAVRWAKGTAILFAVGAVSGTVLSFELGLLWPRFMEVAGPMIGLPFSLEGFAFFLEAIFLGLYLYGRGRISPRLHLASAAIIAVSGLASGVFVMAVNSFMHTPTGFRIEPDGTLYALDPWAAFSSSSFPTQAWHMALASYSSVAFLVLGIHAWGLLRNPERAFHRRAASIAFGVAIASAPLQVFTGDRSAKHLAAEQPIKLAAAESLFESQRSAPLLIGGWPNVESRTVDWGVELPGGLSFLGKGDFDAPILGLDSFPREEWPPVFWVHAAFQVMVACGFALLGLAGWGALLVLLRRPIWTQRWFLRAAIAAAPLGLIATEAGWVLTEVGRQPWIIRGILRVDQAVTPMPGLVLPFTTFTLLYFVLGTIVVLLLRAHVFKAEAELR